ncbi:hypothetical protein [Streptomyces sp. NPDC050759]|uniref:RraA family protein n=1 Tax=Streptomyces sp. NPDC050759 TaxID=3365635 RepID=UPI0037B5D5AD
MSAEFALEPADDEIAAHAKVAAFLKETGVSTCAVADALDGLGVANAVLDSGLKCLSQGGTMSFGAAFPVSWAPVRKGSSIVRPGPSTWSEVRDFLVPEVTDGSGRFYVAGAGPLVTEAALAGGMSTTYLIETLGFEGMVLGGAIRDQDLVAQVPAPVVASNFIPTDTQGAYRVVSAGDRCLVGSTVIVNGDWIFTDGNGTAVVPHDLLGETLTAAAGIEEREAATLTRVRSGERLPELVDALGQI